MPRLSVKNLLICVLVASALFGGYFLFRYVNPPAPREELSRRYGIRPGEKILVFAPHSDDETLAAGGLIQAALGAGADVHIVLVTNGDGFTLAVEDQFHTLRVTPARYIQLAYIRQKETLAALRLLGLPAAKVHFLGFPDRGTAEMWENFWSPEHPYTSRFTRVAASPYRNSIEPGVVYAGARLAGNLQKMLREIAPNVIVIPHPNDTHPDHWGTHNFVMYALAQSEGLRGAFPWTVRRPRLLNYLVHRGDWPAPKGAHLDAGLVPPPPLFSLGLQWGLLPLTPEETTLKYQAILKYHSQVSIMRRYLVSFARANELFGEVPAQRLPKAGEAGWPEVSVLIQDPQGDTVAREAQGEADIKQVRLGRTAEGLRIMIESRRPITRAVQFILHVHALATESLGEPLRYDLSIGFKGGKPVAVPSGRGWGGAKPFPVALQGGGMTVDLPKEALGPRGIVFVSAESWIGKAQVDRSAWRVFTVR